MSADQGLEERVVRVEGPHHLQRPDGVGDEEVEPLQPVLGVGNEPDDVPRLEPDRQEGEGLALCW